MTYNVCGGTLSLTQSINQSPETSITCGRIGPHSHALANRNCIYTYTVGL